jgi:hypothetical protein
MLDVSMLVELEGNPIHEAIALDVLRRLFTRLTLV